MTYDVHVGTLDTGAAQQCLISFPVVLATFSNGDDWHVWGEVLGEHGFKHVVARVETIGQAIDLARYVVKPDEPLTPAFVLQPMAGIPNHYEPGTLAVVSDTDDWAEQYLTVYSNRAILKRRVLR